VPECWMNGSAYGDISSERVVVKLEQMVCLIQDENNSTYLETDIVANVHGEDGSNDLRGDVVSTSIKHLKSAALGGMISGLLGAAQGQDGMTIGSGGVVTTPSKGMGSIVKSGAFGGASNVGETIAEFALKEAEMMSPVLEVKPGVLVMPKILEGFYVGEKGVMKKLSEFRARQKQKNQQSKQR